MLDDVKSKKINLVLAKSVSRFGRNTVDSLQAMQTIRNASGIVYFDEEHIYSDDDNDLVLTIYSSVAEEYSKEKSAYTLYFTPLSRFLTRNRLCIANFSTFSDRRFLFHLQHLLTHLKCRCNHRIHIIILILA